MQVRKLVKSGSSSLVTAIPSDWIKRNKLKAGDLVYINDEGRKLIIDTDAKQEAPKKREVVLNTENKDERVIRFDITSAYMDNYKYIIIKGNNLSKFVQAIKKEINGLVALELVEETSEKLVARNFLDLTDSNVKVILRRMDNIVRSMIIDSKLAITDSSIIPAITDRDNEVNKLSFLVFKVLKTANTDKSTLRALGITEMDILRYWELTIYLEKVGDGVKNSLPNFEKLDSHSKKVYLELITELEKAYIEAMTAFYELSIPMADKVLKKKNIIINDIRTAINKSKSSEFSQIAVNLFYIASVINGITKIVRYLD